jgi:hypothetical protein
LSALFPFHKEENGGVENGNERKSMVEKSSRLSDLSEKL